MQNMLMHPWEFLFFFLSCSPFYFFSLHPPGFATATTTPAAPLRLPSLSPHLIIMYYISLDANEWPWHVDVNEKRRNTQFRVSN